MAVRTGNEQVRPAGSGRRTGKRLERVSFRHKLDMLVALPSLVILGLLAPLVSQEVHTAQAWASAAGYMQTTAQVSFLIDDLVAEQENALGVVGDVPLVGEQAFDDAVANTNAQKDLVVAAYHGHPPADMVQALVGVDALAQVRASVHSRAIEGAILLQAYSTVVESLSDAMDLAQEASSGNPATVSESELDVLFQADQAASLREAALAAIADYPSDSSVEYPIAEQEDGVSHAQSTRLSKLAEPADFELFDSVQRNGLQGQIDDFETAAAAAYISPAAGSLAHLKSYARVFTDAALAQATARSVMEHQVTGLVVSRAQHSASAAATAAIALVLVAVVLLIGLLIFSVLVRHSIVRPVIRLTTAATRVANVAEQDLQRVVDDDVPGVTSPPDLESVQVGAQDEIGDLADAFNRLQSTAVRVLERQVTIRRNTAEMFGNVGRRIYNLTGRQLTLIDAVERSETDPVLLERFYRIDHLAVRLQRSADCLVLLSGERESAVDSTPLRLTDIVRSAIGRVEGYQRVVLNAEGDTMVAPATIGDLMLMFAELLENAVAFSPTSSTVDVAVRTVPRGAIVEIADHGVGMTLKRLLEENELLVKRDRLDLAPTKVLGLFVVGRLAQRTGVRVELSQTPGGGMTARATIPHDLLLGPVGLTERPAPAPAPVPRAVPSAPMPEPRREVPSTPVGLPQRTPRGGTGPGENGAPRPASGPPAATPLLPRRVRGARPQPQQPPKQGVSLAPPVELDAEAARAAIEEFEAGVDQALRDSARELPVRPPAVEANLPGPGDTDEEKGERP